MLRNIKEKIKNVLCDLIYRLGQLIMFFIDIVLHPIKNISCIFIVVLYVLLEKTNIHKLSGKDMFLFSAGMVTVLTKQCNVDGTRKHKQEQDQYPYGFFSCFLHLVYLCPPY